MREVDAIYFVQHGRGGDTGCRVEIYGGIASQDSIEIVFHEEFASPPRDLAQTHVLISVLMLCDSILARPSRCIGIYDGRLKI